jgi:transketolase
VIGYGAPNQGRHRQGPHGSPLGKDEIAAPASARLAATEPFVMPARTCSTPGARSPARGARRRKAWAKRLAAMARQEQGRVQTAASPATCPPALRRGDFRVQAKNRHRREARRRHPQVVGMALEVINGVLPELVGGSADLTGSNNTKTSHGADHAADYGRPLHPLRHPRARHGGGDERHGAAWRHHSPPTAAPSWCSPITAARRSALPR